MELLIKGLAGGWILDVIRKTCIVVDAFIYTLAGWLFNVFFDLCSYDLKTNLTSIEEIINRTMVFVGIIALFVLVKSFLEIMVDPDKMNANGEKIVHRTIFSLILLVTFPFIFDVMEGFQQAVVNSNAIPRLILPEDMMNDATQEDGYIFTMNNLGNIYMNNVFLLFFKYEDPSLLDNVLDIIKIAASLVPGVGAVSGIYNVFDAIEGAIFDDPLSAIEAVQRGASILALQPYTNSSHVDYHFPIISTIVGLVFCYYFVQIAIATGVRIFKLLFLQIIAPFPIILNINSKTEQIFKSYLKYLGKIYVDLFVRMLVVMLVYTLMLTMIDTIDSNVSGNLVLSIVIIIAMLKFAKDFPNIISDIFNLNFKLADKGPEGFLNKIFSGTKGFFGGALGGAISLGASAITGSNSGLKGRDLAGHMAMNTWKGASAGSKGLKNGIGAFGSSVLDNAANSYATANQIKNAGGISNYSKGRMLQRIGYDKYDAGESERLADAVRVAESEKNKYNDYLSKVKNLREASQDYFAKAMMQANNEEGMAYARNLSIVRNNGAGVSLAEYKSALDFVSSKDRELEDFYNGRSSSLSGTAAYAELSALKSAIVKEVQDVDQQLGSLINSFDTLGQASTKLSEKYTEADKNLDAAQAANKAYINSDIHRLVNMKAPKNKNQV